ncbi:subtilisin-like protein [Dendrothele bispora CBS 962.96]|uniref:tripeptidyl-peptidase II n=1 Tax=Dendrothele bispora (strain CBS 962.96) TaxID=1314807 RepID=A0A4S8MWQ1_DENBC|nr:subtilisin-like protein [Dendrothele bispora CBS 962.96]
MRWSTTLVLIPLLGLAAAKPVLDTRYSTFQTKHSWVQIPKGWEYHSTPPSDTLISLRLGLKQAKFEELLSHLYQVSDPTHARYGQHLSKTEVDALVQPNEETVNAVSDWLSYHGIDESAISASREWVTITVPLHLAETLLDTKYHVYSHAGSDERVLRTLSYSLPAHLHGHIDVVAPTTYFSTLKSMRATSFLQPEIPALSLKIDVDTAPAASDAVPAASCNTTITPQCLRTLYNTIDYEVTQADKNTLGVAGYLDEFANFADLKTFAQRFRPDATNATFQLEQISNGGNDQTDPGVEANLDIQYTIGMAFPTPNIYYSTGGSPPFNPDSQTPTNTNEPYLDWLNFVLAQDTLPQTFTTSYGDDEQTVPTDYAISVCNLLAQLGTRGSSVMFSSGDFGVGGGDCQTNDGQNKTQFQPAFPASCPFVTTVGGTTRVNPEIVADFSGGGFSNLFARPDYQADAVSGYLNALGDQFQGLFNKSGRAYPDVAAQGEGFQVVIGGRVGSVGGTSASSPTFAGIIALLNDFRLSKGLSSLGFLNPLLYSNPDVFNDIVSGSNPGCGTDGFSAALNPGWDPVTGLGTPDFKKLQAVV